MSEKSGISDRAAVLMFVGVVLTLLVAGLALSHSLNAEFAGQNTKTEMQRIADNVAQSSAQEYQIAKVNGTPMDACVHAGATAEAFLQAHDDYEYRVWKDRQHTDCLLAGLPSQ